jgi:tetratricopeptide (TPR) repeat protein
MKNKQVAGLLALFFGIFGTHRFYLGQHKRGILYFVLFLVTFFITTTTFAWTGPPPIILPALLAFVDALVLLAMPGAEFDAKYNRAFAEVDYAPQPAYRQPPRRSGRFYRQLGIREYRRGRYEAAAKAFAQALESSPDDPTLAFNLACCYSQLQDADRGFANLERALDMGFQPIDKIYDHPALGYLHSLEEMDDFIANGFRRAAPELELPAIDEKPEEKQHTELPAGDLLAQIEELGRLKEQGILTDEEFEAQKKRWLKE